jgi:ATP-dependent DNA helicase DinG
LEAEVRVAFGSVPAPTVRQLLDAAVAAVGGTERPGQVDMAIAVADAIETGEHLLVQAGTGTGKSLAYLVPAVHHALTAERPVIVATATLALQGQIVDRDLPGLVEAVAPLVKRRPTYAMLKGRRNYLCRYRLAGGVPDDMDALFDATPSTALGRDVVRLRGWAEETETGDRDELLPGVSDRAWRQVSVSAGECVGAARCPFGHECFAEQARAAAGEADIVVTNHALLAIDALEEFAVLPEHDIVVVDEAHELVDRVTGVATAELAPGALDRAIKRAWRLVPQTVGVMLDHAGSSFVAALEGTAEGRLDSMPQGLGDATAVLRDAVREALSEIGRDKDEDGSRRVAKAALTTVFETASRVLGGSTADVVWVTRSERFGASLHVAPLSVAGILRSSLFSDATVVLTSATLELGGSFDAVAGSMGLVGVGAPPYRGLDAGSPFDYGRQGILYVARRLAAPGRDGINGQMLDELAALVDAAGGRTLGLFSSMRAAQVAAEFLRDRDVPVLCQGEETTGELVRQFAGDARTCLFGTLSLWQGVDVPGSALQLVVIDRIPFPRPDDPLMSARARAADAAGGNGFMSVAATHAALRLAQGSGRLIRTSQDRGVVAVLDSRLHSARYAGFLRGSLPPFWYTTDFEQVRRSLVAIDASAPPVRPVAPRVSRAAAASSSAVSTVTAPVSTWGLDDDALLRLGVEAGRPVEQLAARHDCSVDEVVARIETLGLHLVSAQPQLEL